MTDFEVGTKVLKAFYSKANLKVSYQAMLNQIQPNLVKQRIGIEGIGFGVNSVNEENTYLSDSAINSSMSRLAMKLAGKIPSGFQSFFNFLSNESTNINYIAAIAVTVKDSVGDVLEGAQAVGDSLLTTGKLLTTLLPIAALVIAFFWVNAKTGNKLVK